jgi:hypothetical protein
MTTMLGIVPEVAPPAFLLEQIEAVTINRNTVWKRLRMVFDVVPQSAGWATAGVTAAIVLIALMLSQPGGRQVAERLMHGTDGTAITQPVQSTSGGSVKPIPQPSSVEVAERPARGEREVRSHRVLVAKTLSHKEAAGSVKAAKDIESPTADEVSSVPAEPVVVALAEPSSDDVMRKQQENEAAKLARAKAYQEAKLAQEAETLAQIHAEMKAGSRYGRAAGVDGKGYAVELASIRF